MKHRPEQYAEALYEALKDKKVEEQKDFIMNFVRILKKNKDSGKIPLILNHFEKKYVEANGLTKVHIESVQPLSKEL